MSRPTSFVLSTAAVLALAGAVVVAPAAASASPAGDAVVINELYAAGGSAGAPYANKFVELYNPTGADVDLAGWSVQYRSATGTAAATGVAALTGVVPAGSHFLVQLGSNGATGAALPTPDVVSGVNPSASSGTVMLVQSVAAVNPGTGDVRGAEGVVDLVGYGSSNTFETTAAEGLGGTGDQRSTQRTDGADTDVNTADFTRAAPSPEGTGGAATPTPTPTGTPTAPADVTPIRDVQGSGDASPLVGQTVTTEGVVTGVYATGGLAGFNIQEPGAVDPAATASTGLFVYAPSLVAGVAVGDSVRVSGPVSEYFGSTQLTATTLAATEAPLAAVEPAAVAWPETAAQRERWEGMLVAPTGSLTVADNYSLNRFGELTLATDGQPLVTPTQVGAPGSAEAQAQVDHNAAHSVVLDDGASTDFLRVVDGLIPNGAVPLPYLTLETPVTVGAPVTFASPVVVHYAHDRFRFQPQVTLTGDNPQDAPATFGDVRTAAPEAVGGDLVLGTFNVLNYFTDLGVDSCTASQNYKDREGEPVTANGCRPRGAWDQEDFERQQAKIVAAITAMDADIVSLEEIEDSSDFGQERDASLAALVAALNAAAGGDVWSFVPSPAAVPSTGDDVIRTAFIYKSASVALAGESAILDDPAFANGRAPLAQGFVDVASDEAFVVIVNHFKSKGGSGTGDNEDRDDAVGPAGAVGGWNGDRTRQAQALVAFSDAQQAERGTDRVLLVGDFNSYAKETPITTMTDAGYVDLGELAPGEYSYLFDGAVGSLDHVLASPAAAELVTGADIWTINANESVALEYSRHNYNVTPLYAADPYRSSDHNPMVVGLGFTPESTGTPTPTDTPAPTDTAGPTEPGATTPGPGAAPDGGLASTGGPIDPWVWGAVVALLVAGGAALATRRRRA